MNECHLECFHSFMDKRYDSIICLVFFCRVRHFSSFSLFVIDVISIVIFIMIWFMLVPTITSLRFVNATVAAAAVAVSVATGWPTRIWIARALYDKYDICMDWDDSTKSYRVDRITGNVWCDVRPLKTTPLCTDFFVFSLTVQSLHFFLSLRCRTFFQHHHLSETQYN